MSDEFKTYEFKTCAWKGCGRADVVAWSHIGNGYPNLWWCTEHAEKIIKRDPPEPPTSLEEKP